MSNNPFHIPLTPVQHAVVTGVRSWLDTDQPPLALCIDGQSTVWPALAVVLQGALYVRLRGWRISLEGLRAQIAHERAAQPDDPGCLVLDEYDRADEQALAALVRQAGNAGLPGRVILLGRALPHRIQTSDAPLYGLTTRLPALPASGLPGTRTLHVRMLGTDEVLSEGRRIIWTGDQARLLFYYLVDRALVTRDEIFKAFWPTASKQDATNIFHVTKNKIARALPASSTGFTRYQDHFYRIAPTWHVVSDVTQFLDLVQQADAASANSIHEARLLTEAATLYRGDFLAGSSENWVIERRRHLRETMADVLYRLGQHAGRHNDAEMACHHWVRAVRFDQTRQDIYTAVLTALRALGHDEDACRLALRVRQALQAAKRPADPMLTAFITAVCV